MQVIKFNSVNILALFLLLLSIFAMVFTGDILSYRPDYIYRCDQVIDGDTIIASRAGRKLRIRLAYIDAPESSQKSFDKKLIGAYSKESLKKMILEEKIKIKIISRDLYGRYIGILFKNKKNINLEMVERGQAIFFDAKTKYIYKLAEYRAKIYRRGIWRTEGFLLPRYYRKINRPK